MSENNIDKERVIKRIKNLYEKGMTDKSSVMSAIRASTPMTLEDFDLIHAEAIKGFIESTTDSKDAKRAKALMRLSYLQSKLMEDLTPSTARIVSDIEKLRMALEATESPKEFNATINNSSVVAVNKEEADNFFKESGMINVGFNEDNYMELDIEDEVERLEIEEQKES